MADTTVFTIGAEASCTDGVCGDVIRVVVDPIAHAVTHVVVEPKHRQGLGRLVPLDLVDATPDQIRLRCHVAEFEKLDYAEETQFLLDGREHPGYGKEDVLTWPYYGLGMEIGPRAVTYDKVPLGEVTVRRGEPVEASDGAIGRVEGLVIDPRDRHVTHVLLQEGHLWGRKEVAIPIGAVTGITPNGIRLSLTKQEIRELPAVDLDHPVG